jgi:uncharacterized protein involved in exopolysaccharide biosynthesis
LSAAFSGSATLSAKAGDRRQITPLVSLKRHYLIAVVIGVSLTTLGVPLAVLEGKPKYFAQAAIRISPVFSRTLQEDDELRFNSNSDYRQFVDQQIVDINSYETAAAALSGLGARRWLWQRHGETQRWAAERLMAALSVQAVPDTYLVTVSLQSTRLNGLADIVNAVVAAYLTRQQSQELYASDQRVRLLQSRRKDLENQATDDFKRQAEIAQELGVSTFEEKFINPYDKALVDADEALDGARRGRIGAEAKLAALRPQLKQELDLPLDSEAQELLANDRALGDLRSELYRCKAAAFLQLRGLAPGHPGRRALLEELTSIDNELAQITAQALSRIRTMLLKNRANKIREELSQAEADADEARRTEAGLADQLNTLRSQVAEFTNRYNEALSLRSQSDRARKQIDDIDNRIDFFTLESKTPGFVRLASAARAPEIPLKGGRTKIFLLFAIAGVGLGGVVPAIVDYFDPRVLSSGELAAILGFPPLGVTLDDTTARARDLIKPIALGIAREWRSSGTRLFILTGCHLGAGVTTLVLQLAREISAIGVKTIAVETNIEHLDQRYRSSIAAPGLVEALSGMAPLESAISVASGELPPRIALGNVADFHRVWKIAALQSLFALLLEKYDLVLVDAPPLLDSAEPELLMGLSAAVILVVIAREFSTVVRRAAQLLQKFSPPVVGTVFSRMIGEPASASDAMFAGLPFKLPLEGLARRLWHDSE